MAKEGKYVFHANGDQPASVPPSHPSKEKRVFRAEQRPPMKEVDASGKSSSHASEKKQTPGPQKQAQTSKPPKVPGGAAQRGMGQSSGKDRSSPSASPQAAPSLRPQAASMKETGRKRAPAPSAGQETAPVGEKKAPQPIRRSGRNISRPAPVETKPAAQQLAPPPQSSQKPQVEKPGRTVPTMAQMTRMDDALSAKRRTAKLRIALAVLLGCVLLSALVWLLANRDTSTEAPAKAQPGEWPAFVGDRQIDAPPQRLVSLSPMITKTLLSLPANDVLCGVTEYCPTEGRSIETVGTPLLPRVDKIKELAPDYVLCQTPLPDNVAKGIEESGARILQIPAPTDLASLREFYGQLGALLLGEKTGRPIGTAMIDRLEDSLRRVKAVLDGEKTALMLPDLSGLAATADTPEGALLGQVFAHPLPQETNWLAGAACLTDEDPENDLEAIRQADPDLLFVPSSVEPEELSKQLGSLRAVQNGCVVYYDRQLAENLSPFLLFDIVRGAQLAGLTAPTPQLEEEGVSSQVAA